MMAQSQCNSKESRTSGICSQSSEEIDVLSASSGRTNRSAFRNPDLTLNHLLNHLPDSVREMSWFARNKLSIFLNPCKIPSGDDWRSVASHLGFTTTEIELFEKAENPTMEILRLCNNTSTEELFKTIQRINRYDVIEDLLKCLSCNENAQIPCLPTQESLEEDFQSSLSTPLTESSSNVSKISKQPSEQEDEEKENEFAKFICSEESQNFWRAIPGPHSEKKWKDFLASSIQACPEELRHGGIDKFLCHVFKIDYDERQDGVVRVDFFYRLLAFFGPYIPGEDGCLGKMYSLMKNSVSKSTNNKVQSWFAGYMNKEEAEKRLSETTPGSFLIRFSGSKVDEGWFVLSVKTRKGVEQIEIEKDTVNNKLFITEDEGGQSRESFTDLAAIVDKMRQEVIFNECPQLLINPCPDLPLNSHFTSYTAVTRGRGQVRGRGRGQGRGRAR